jgi:hypothetical protein
MVTNNASARKTTHVEDCGETLGPIAQALLKLRQSLCGIHGHDSLLHFEQDRMFLRCTSCGHETPGWEIGKDQPDVRFREANRPVSVPRLVGARKIA